MARQRESAKALSKTLSGEPPLSDLGPSDVYVYHVFWRAGVTQTLPTTTSCHLEGRANSSSTPTMSGPR